MKPGKLKLLYNLLTLCKGQKGHGNAGIYKKYK